MRVENRRTQVGKQPQLRTNFQQTTLRAQGRLDFEAPDLEAFPCLRLAYAALAAGGSAPAVLNAANEEAVSAFLQGRIGFLSIPALVEEALQGMSHAAADSLDALLDADAGARTATRNAISRKMTAGKVNA